MILESEFIRLEYSDEKSNKFWELYKNSSGYMASWGKIGAKPQSIQYDHNTAQKKLHEKLAKGYVVTKRGNIRDKKEDKLLKDTGPKIDFMKEIAKL